MDISIILMAKCGDDMLTFLNVGDINNELTLITGSVMWDLVALLLFLVFALVRSNRMIMVYISNYMTVMPVMVVWLSISLGRGGSTINHTCRNN